MSAAKFNTPEEEALIGAVQKGDRVAFEKLYCMYERLVYNTAMAKLGNVSDALDVSQDVFVKIWKSIARYRGDCRFSTWVYKIAINTSLDFLRRAKASHTEAFPSYIDGEGDEVEIEFADESVGASPERMTEKREVINNVRSAIARLSPEAREVVELRDIQGFSYDEIAEMTGLEVGTVKSRLNRARGQLRELLLEHAKK